MRNFYHLLALLMLGICSGCARPARVDRTDSPMTGLFVTVETNYAIGPASADFTRVYAHLEAHGESDKKLVLDGHYLEHTKVIWPNLHEITLCMPEGFTDTFRNYVTLSAGGVTQMIHAHIQEHCQS
jgi:hypothetical protein